jgi:dolichol-phosphate mannosyltransferase
MHEKPGNTREHPDPEEVELTVLAPMYNEAENIESTVSSITTALRGFHKPWELLFVDDGSTDATLTIVREWEARVDNLRVISYPVNCGRGKALRTGFENAHGRFVITIDFDLSYGPEHILRIYHELVRPDQMVDVVLGSPYMEGGEVTNVNPFRLLVSRLGNKVLQYSFPQKFKTTTSILRGYRREVLQALDLESDGKEIHLETLSKLCALGFRAKEIPATLGNRKKARSKFEFRNTAISHMMFSLFEKPILLFGMVGFFLILAGLLIGIYLVWLRYTGSLSPTRPLISLVILLFVVGSQFFCFAFIASQNNFLRKEIYRLQRHIRLLENQNRGKK